MFKNIKNYWLAYGGIKALLTSFYLWFAFFFTISISPFWLNHSWWNDALGMLPMLVSFTLAGFSIWIGIGDSDFKKYLVTMETDNVSLYMIINATFVHFTFVQMFAIFLSLFAKSFNNHPVITCLVKNINFFIYIQDFLSFLGCFIFIYALSLTFSLVLNIFNISTWYSLYIKNKYKNEK